MEGVPRLYRDLRQEIVGHHQIAVFQLQRIRCNGKIGKVVVAALMFCAAHRDIPRGLLKCFFIRKGKILLTPPIAFLYHVYDTKNTTDHPGRAAEPEYVFTLPEYDRKDDTEQQDRGVWQDSLCLYSLQVFLKLRLCSVGTHRETHAVAKRLYTFFAFQLSDMQGVDLQRPKAVGRRAAALDTIRLCHSIYCVGDAPETARPPCRAAFIAACPKWKAVDCQESE